MICYVVTEGPSDASLLRALLNPEFSEEEGLLVTSGGGRSGADSLARSILVARGKPVALVVDSDTNDSNRIQENQQFLEFLLGQFGRRSEWEVILIIPEIETLYFEDKSTLETLTGVKATPEQLLRGKYEPKKVLKEMLPNDPDYLQKLANKAQQLDLQPLRDTAPIRKLREFVARHVAGVTPVGASV